MAPTPLGDETAALLACGEHAVLSHHSAALLWQLLPEWQGDRRIHVTIRGRHGRCLAGVVAHRTTALNRRDVRIVGGLPVTSAIRTLKDVAPYLDGRALEDAVEEGLRHRLFTERQLLVAGAANGHRGAARLMALLKSRQEDGVTRRGAEKRFRELVRASGLPPPQTNVWLHGHLVDAYWPEAGLVVEVQSHGFHSGRAALERDTRKAARLTAAGLRVSYVTWFQMNEEPFAVVARLAQSLAWAEGRRAA